MAGYINPEVVNIDNPKGVDYAIRRLQYYLTAVLWLEKIYPRVTIQRGVLPEKGVKNPKEITYPEVWGKNGEPDNLMPNDNLVASCFFIAHDPATYDDYDPLDTQISVVQEVSIVFWVNLKKLDNTRSDRYSEVVKIQILNILRNAPSFVIEKHEEEYDEVFKEFTLTGNAKNYLKPPFYGLRITGKLYYKMFSENVCETPEDTFLPNFAQKMINSIMSEYAPRVLDFVVGTDIEAGVIVEILRPYGFGTDEAPLALSEVEILNVIWQNTALQGVTVSGETMNFGVIGGLPNGSKITLLFRKKIPT